MSGFDERIALSPWLSPRFFLIATMATIMIATAAIFMQAWHAARVEPAIALRDE